MLVCRFNFLVFVLVLLFFFVVVVHVFVLVCPHPRVTLVLLAPPVLLVKMALRVCAVMAVHQADREMLGCADLLVPLERKESLERMVPL